MCSARAEKHNNQQPSGGTTQAKTTAQRAQLKKKAKEYGGTKGRLSEYSCFIFLKFLFVLNAFSILLVVNLMCELFDLAQTPCQTYIPNDPFCRFF